jgi:acetyl-CoA carboxylase carboxyltransferase component
MDEKGGKRAISRVISYMNRCQTYEKRTLIFRIVEIFHFFVDFPDIFGREMITTWGQNQSKKVGFAFSCHFGAFLADSIIKVF